MNSDIMEYREKAVRIIKDYYPKVQEALFYLDIMYPENWTAH